VTAQWWYEREAERLAQQGDYKRAYEALRALVPAEPKDDANNGVDFRVYSEQLEEDVIELEKRNEKLKDALEACRGELEQCRGEP
jgi:outer membrane protein TolC